jgi:hypothetical protein
VRKHAVRAAKRLAQSKIDKHIEKVFFFTSIND